MAGPPAQPPQPPVEYAAVFSMN